MQSISWVFRLYNNIIKSPSGLIGFLIILSHLIVALSAPLIAPYSPFEFHVEDSLQPPSKMFFLGTDNYGRDTFSRVLYGGRTAIAISAGATALGIILGVILGMIAGHYGGIIDEVLMRVADALMSFPSLLLALFILAILGPAVINLIIGIGVVFAPNVARIIRSVVLSIRTKEYIKAAHIRGENALYIIVVEMLPNTIPELIVESSVRLSYAVLIVGTLGFLGLGVQPPSPDWGRAVAEARGYIAIAPWLVLAPSVAISSLIIGSSLLADVLQKTLDPASYGYRGS